MSHINAEAVQIHRQQLHGSRRLEDAEADLFGISENVPSFRLQNGSAGAVEPAAAHANGISSSAAALDDRMAGAEADLSAAGDVGEWTAVGGGAASAAGSPGVPRTTMPAMWRRIAHLPLHAAEMLSPAKWS